MISKSPSSASTDLATACEEQDLSSLRMKTRTLNEVGASPLAIRIWQLIDYIDEHLGEDLSIAHLAVKIGLSPSHLVNVFEKEMQETPGEFVRRLRLERAADHLKHNRLTPLMNVALAYGFQSAAVFSRSFHDWFQFSPSEWRLGAHWRRCGQGSCWRKKCEACNAIPKNVVHTPQMVALQQHPFARGKPQSIDLESARVIDIPSMDMVYLRGLHAGSIGGWLPLWQRWANWANINEADTGPCGAVLQHLDNADICARTRTRADIGFFIDPHQPTPAGLARKCLRGGRFALVQFRGNWLDEVLSHEYGWLASFEAMGLRFDPHRASFKFFNTEEYRQGQIPGLENGQVFKMNYAFAVVR